jgi:hypothetical protein
MDLRCERCKQTFPSPLWFEDEGRSGRWICIECAKLAAANDTKPSGAPLAGPTQDSFPQGTSIVQAASIVIDEIKALLTKRIIDEVKGALLCGGILILTGACVLYLFACMGFESLWHLGGGLESERVYYLVVGLVLAAIITVGLTLLGFFVTRQNRTPFWCTPTWYAVICGIIPGFLLLLGWIAIGDGLAKAKELHIAGFRSLWNRQRGTVIITAIVVLFWVFTLKVVLMA